MLKHFIMWQLKTHFAPAERLDIRQNLQQQVAALRTLYPGIKDYTVFTPTQSTGNYDVLLEAVFDTDETFYAFQHDPVHLQVAQYIQSVVQNKACVDFYCQPNCQGGFPMIRHVVTWRFYDTLSACERQSAAAKLKQDIEALQEQIEGVLSLSVTIDALPTCNPDILLDSTFASAEALAAYQIHPLHQAVGQYLSTVAGDRACIDFEIH